MKVHEYREMMKYLTRPDVSKIEIPTPAPKAPVEPQEMSSEEHAAHLNAQIEQGYATGGRVGFKDGSFPTGFEHRAFKPLTKEQREIAKTVYGLKESEVDDWQSDLVNKAKKKNIQSGLTTLETKASNLNPNRIIVSTPKGSEEINDVIFPDKKTEKNFLKDLKERFSQSQGKSEKNIKYFSENYPISERQATRAIKFLQDKYELDYATPQTKSDIRNRLAENLKATSDLGVERDVVTKIKKPFLQEQDLMKKIDLAHRVSKEHMKQLGLQFNTRTTGFDSRLINQVIIKPSEDILEKLYRKQRNLIDDIKKNGLTDELSGKLEDINDKVRVEAKKTNGRLIGVTVDPETLDVSFEGKKAKLGLTDKVLDIKEIAQMSPDKKIKFLTNQITPRIQAEIDRGFTPYDFKEILADPKRQEAIFKYANKYTPDLVDDVKELFKNPASKKSLPLYSFPANLVESNVLGGLGKAAKGYWNLSGGLVNPALGAVLNSEELQEKGLSEGEAATYGAIKAVLQDAPNFAIGVTRAIGNKILPSPVQQLFSDGEEKGFFETALNDKTVDISKMPFFGSDWYKDRFVSGKQEVERKIDRDLRKEYARQLLRRNPYPPVTDFGPVEGPQDYITPEQDKEIKEYMLNKSLQQDPELRKKYEQDKPAIDFGFKKEAEFKTGGRVGYKDGSDDDLEIPTIKNEDEYFGKKAKDVPEKGLEGLRVGFMDVKKRPDVILNKSEEEGGGATGGIRELKQLLLNNMQQLNPMIGYGGENYNAYISKGINPYGDKSLRYGAAYTPEGDKGTFTIDKGPGSIGAGYHYNDDNLTLGIGALKDKLSGEKSIMLRGNYAFATGGRASFQTGGSANFLKMLRNISDSVRELKNSTHMLGYTAKSEGIAKAAEEALAPYAGGFKGNKHETLLQKIQNAKEHLPKEYHGVLDEMKSYADKHAYDAVDDMAKALDKTIDPNLKFENLSKKMFPMEDPLNDAFIIIDPEKGHSVGRYVQRHTVDQNTGRGIIQTVDTWDPVNRRFLTEEEQKLIGVQSIEKGKEGLN
jgi:hypothetical protein